MRTPYLSIALMWTIGCGEPSTVGSQLDYREPIRLETERTATQQPGVEPSAPDEQSAPTVSTDVSPGETGSLTPVQWLIRLSIDLRGIRPPLSEVEEVRRNPDAISGLIDRYLQDPRFPGVVSDLASRGLRNRFSDYPAPGAEDLGDENYQISVSQEPLRLLEHIVGEDLSYAVFLTADYTFVDEYLADHWSVSGYDWNAGGWQRVTYRDERPAAGYLSMNSFYLRFLTDGINFNRGRANAASRALLCDDYLKRPIDFPRNIDLTDEEGIRTAVKSNQGCASCHGTLDPLASYFSGFSDLEGTEGGVYLADDQDSWEETTEVTPGFRGQGGRNVGDLARQIVADPRFSLCLTKRMFEGLVDRAATREDDAALRRHDDVFRSSGMNIKALFGSIIRDPVYRGVRDREREVLHNKLMSPERLSDVLGQLTGLSVVRGRFDLMRSEADGFLVLGGGLSSLAGERPSRTVNVSRVLVQGRVSEAAAWRLLFRDTERFRDVFGEVDPETENLSVPIATQALDALFGLKPDETDALAADYVALYRALVGAGASSRRAWAAVVATIFRDPVFQVY